MKKSIGPIVASSFLLVVVVISTVSFQNWFTSFEATTLASAESKTSGSSNGTTQIADIIGTSLYFQNGYPNLTVKSIRVYENDCNVSTTIGSGVKTLTLGNNCTQNLPNERAEVSVVTDKGIFRGAFYNEYAGVNTTTVTSTSASLSLSINDTSVPYNGNVNLSWTAENVATCSASGGWSGSKSNTTGSEVVSSLTSNTTFTLNCSGLYGNTSESVDVTVADPICPGPGSQTFTLTETVQPLNVPAGCTLNLKIWGAGGGGGHASANGGGGGFTNVSFIVGSIENFSIIIGERGVYKSSGDSTSAPYGGGGQAYGSFGNGWGQGGGYSGIFNSSTIIQNNALAIAGGGGGGGNTALTGVNSGGAGGGETGLNATRAEYGGHGGTQNSGGVAYTNTGSVAGSALQGGGCATEACTGAGGGYFGGGSAVYTDPPGNGIASGGGSGYCSGTLSFCETSAGSLTSPGGTTDVNYSSSYSGGGATGGNGENGRIVTYWS